MPRRRDRPGRSARPRPSIPSRSKNPSSAAASAGKYEFEIRSGIASFIVSAACLVVAELLSTTTGTARAHSDGIGPDRDRDALGARKPLGCVAREYAFDIRCGVTSLMGRWLFAGRVKSGAGRIAIATHSQLWEAPLDNRSLRHGSGHPSLRSLGRLPCDHRSTGHCRTHLAARGSLVGRRLPSERGSACRACARPCAPPDRTTRRSRWID